MARARPPGSGGTPGGPDGPGPPRGPGNGNGDGPGGDGPGGRPRGGSPDPPKNVAGAQDTAGRTLQGGRPGGRGPGGPRRGGSGTPPGGGRPRSNFDPVTPGWTRVDAQNAPQHVRDAANGFEPRPPGTQRPTRGTYEGESISSGMDRSLASDLAHERVIRPDGRPLSVPPDVFFAHAESRVTADMRARARNGENADAEVVLDNTPCGSRGFDSNYPLTCERLLPGMIPAGSRLTIWATVDGGQTFHRKVVVGTGSLIRP